MWTKQNSFVGWICPIDLYVTSDELNNHIENDNNNFNKIANMYLMFTADLALLQVPNYSISCSRQNRGGCWCYPHFTDEEKLGAHRHTVSKCWNLVFLNPLPLP